MEPEGSLLHSQQFATCPYTEPVQSSPATLPYLLEDLTEVTQIYINLH